MTDDRDAVHRGLQLYDDLQAAHQEMTVRAESFERSMTLANAENERLRREIKQVRAQRDHFFKAFTALKAKLQGFTHFAKSGASMLDEAIHMAEVQSYGESAGRVEQSVIPIHGRPTR